MKKLSLILFSLFIVCCGGSSSSRQDNTGDPAIGPRAQGPQLVGLWVEPAASPTSTEYRIAIRFSQATSTDPIQHPFTVTLLSPDGTSMSSYDGVAELHDQYLRFIFNLSILENMDIPFRISGNQLEFDDVTLTKSTTDQLPTVTGNGTIEGNLTLSEAASQATFVPGELIVFFDEPTQNNNSAALRLSQDSAPVIEVPGLGTLYRKNNSSQTSLTHHSFKPSLAQVYENQEWTREQIRTLQMNPHVLHVQPNYYYTSTSVPNDPQYATQWQYPLIGLPEAWEITTGSDDVIVAVVDTGVRYDHPDLSPRLLQGYDFISSTQLSGDGNGIDADATDVGDGQGSRSSSWHGTHVSGTIGSATNNGLGTAGVTWRTKILPLRALGIGAAGSTSDIANAILYAAGLQNSSGVVPSRKANVINLSLGGPAQDFLLDQAISRAIQAGVVVVAAAGNSNTSVLGSPASTPGVITVGSIGSDSQKAPYSNFGSRIDVVAPGGNTALDVDGNHLVDGILSTSWNDSSRLPAYTFMQGTSMAAPHVSGVVALMLSLNNTLSAEQVLQILTSTATDLGAAGKDDTFGYGLINVPRALRAVQNRTGSPAALRISQTEIELTSQSTRRTVLIQNAGDGVLSGLSTTIISGSPWLTATLSRTEAPSILNLEANAPNLAPGEYQGRVSVLSSNGSQDIRVTLRVLASTPSDNENVFVTLVDGKTFQVSQQTTTNRSQNFAFRFNQVPAGMYLVLASTDRDGDESLCESGDLCGSYLTYEDPSPLFVPPNITTRIHFSLAPITNGVSQ